MTLTFYKTIFLLIISLSFVVMMDHPAWADNGVEQKSNPAKVQPLTPQVYTIYNIAMDESALTSRLASQNALKKAQQAGLEKLFKKILRQEDNQRLSPLNEGQVAELVSGIEVANEKTSSVRYIADYTVHFNREKIYNYLSSQEIPFAETLSNPVSILPVLEKEGAIILWEKNNPWRQAWIDYDTVNNLVPIKISPPSVINRMAISPWQAQQGQQDALLKFAQQTGDKALYVMSAKIGFDLITEKKYLDLIIYKNDPTFPGHKIRIESQATDSDLFSEAIAEATYWLDNQWKERVLVHFGESSTLNVKIVFDTKTEWFSIKKRLDEVSLIRKIKLNKFTLNSAEVQFEYSGDIDQIILSLDQENLKMSEDTKENTIDLPNSDNGRLWMLSLKK